MPTSFLRTASRSRAVRSIHVRTDAMSENSHTALISVSALADRLAAAARPVILDVRWQVGRPPLRNDYLSAHIPGAHFVDLDEDLASSPGPGGRHPLPAPDDLQRSLRRWGIEPDSTVIVYDGNSSMAAARAWWVLRWAGLADVRVLDGGFRSWIERDQAVESGPVTDAEGSVQVRPGGMPTLDADGAASHADAGRLVDVRAPERFSGAAEPIDPVAGHIPGAINQPTTENINADGTFLSVARLRQRFTDLDGAPVGVYCGSGVTAAHTVLAMHQAGIQASLYPGSWSEWITDPNRPVATGAAG
ncbi:sulfurtransferase [Jatrophihabitans telluris]|uniref:Sulfurtransferase n=1 Tax=Jatrophihabitans telluris TaxID=2038343 RepID=A0ABY4QUC2_9ACTN|nr:sulfurtransferase [Jatrophihabitans telluris]UQX86722.1 sulfurtransferase [Jatrophihabitans telluris]